VLVEDIRVLASGMTFCFQTIALDKTFDEYPQRTSHKTSYNQLNHCSRPKAQHFSRLFPPASTEKIHRVRRK